MNTASIAYLALVLVTYAVFMLALGVIWLRSMFDEARRPEETAARPAAATRPAATEGRRRAA